MNSNFTTEHTSFASEYAGPSGQPPSRFDLKRIVRQITPVVLIVFLLLGIPAAVAVWFLVPLEYNVTGELHFRASTPNVMNDTDSSRDRANYEKWLTTQLDFLQGPTILQRVAQDREVRQIPEVANAKDAYALLRSKVRARSKRNSELVTISVYLKDKAGAALICSKVMDQYLTYYTGQEAAMGSGILDTLRRELASRETALRSLNSEILGLQMELGIPQGSIGQIGPLQVQSHVERLTMAEADLIRETKEIERLEEQIARLVELTALHKSRPSEKLYELEIEAGVNADGRVQNIRSQLAQQETAVGLLRDNSSETNPARQREERVLASLRDRTAATEAQVRGELLEARNAQLKLARDERLKAAEDAQERIDKFQASIRDQDDRQLKAAETMAGLEEKIAEAEEQRMRIREIRQKIDQLYLERNAPARVTQASAPLIPDAPDYGKRIQLMLLALVGAFAAGVGIGLWRELTNQHARTVQDLSSITPLPVLATIPHAKAERLPKGFQPELLMADFPHSPSADEYRRILARIIYPPDDTVEVNSCLIASPTRGDGKTSLACNLAISLAQANRRVLLVDICTRAPQIEERFGLERGEGLSEILYGDVSFRMLIRSTEFPNLKVLGPGFIGDQLKGKLASREMMQFLERAEKDFDHIVIDTPPSLLMSDAKLLAPIVDGVIITVGVGKSTLGMVRRCLSELDQVNANLIGVVLNGLRQTRGGYMAKNLELFYGYANANGNGHGTSLHDLPEMTITESEDGVDTEESALKPAVMLIESDDPEITSDRDSGSKG